MAACLVAPTASKTLDYVDRAFQCIWRYIVDVYNAPADRRKMEKRIKTGVGLIATAQEGADVPYLLSETDRQDVEIRFREVDSSMKEAQTVAEESVKGFGRCLWPFRQKKIKDKLQANESQLKQILEESQRMHDIHARVDRNFL